jgi:hypothetical protein
MDARFINLVIIIIMMWEFEENPIMIEEVGVKITNFSKKYKKGHNSGNSLGR